MQSAERLTCRKRKRKEASDWGQTMRLRQREGGLNTGMAALVDLRDQIEGPVEGEREVEEKGVSG